MRQALKGLSYIALPFLENTVSKKKNICTFHLFERYCKRKNEDDYYGKIFVLTDDIKKIAQATV